MRKNRKIVLSLFLLFFSFLIFLGFNNDFLSNDQVTDINSSIPQSSAVHSPIYIDGNAALDSFFSGNGTDGTYLNPYIIENYIIDANGAGSAIEIRNTNKYIIIRNCYINESGTGSNIAGINLYSSANVTITDCEINNNYYGLYLYYSDNNIIYHNNVSNNGRDGIRLRDSSNNSLYLNTFSDNSFAEASLQGASSFNTWDNGGMGNYWGDYVSSYPSAQNDGVVWDTPYQIDTEQDNYPLVNSPHRNAQPHSPILIDGNSELDAFFSGNSSDGTISNPYIVEYFDINVSDLGSGIEIRNVNKYLIIRNSKIRFSGNNWVTDDSGIELFNCSNIVF